MAITGYQQPLQRALSYLDQLRTTAGGPQRQPSYDPGDPNANPFDTGGGGTAPTGGGTSGGIKLPTFDNSAGDIGIAPEGYQPLTGFPGYYYNPDTNSFRLMTNTTLDANDEPKASFRALTKAEDTQLRGAYKQYLSNGGAGFNGSTGTNGVVDKTMTDYEKAQIGLEQARLAEEQRKQRIGEATDAITALMQRTQGAQTAKLDALPYAVGNMQYYPGLGPSSPAVSLGLADPFKVQGVAFDPNRIMDANAGNPQAAQDLATLRSMAGY